MSAAAVVAAVSSHFSNAQVLAQTKQTFYGISLHENKKRRCFPVIEVKRGGQRSSAARDRRGLEVTSKTAGASKNVEVEVDKPLGLTLGQKPGVGVVITAVESGGNAAKAGLKSGDQVIYTSSFFGDELWPADKLGFTKTAIQAKPDSVYFVISRFDAYSHASRCLGREEEVVVALEFILGAMRAAYGTIGVNSATGAVVDVKRLPKRPAPPRFGRTLTESQKARATHICLDCGFIYTLQTPFDEQPESYVCPQCVAPKKRFAQYDVKRGKAIGGGLPPIGVILGLILGIAGVGALLVYGLQ